MLHVLTFQAQRVARPALARSFSVSAARSGMCRSEGWTLEIVEEATRNSIDCGLGCRVVGHCSHSADDLEE